MDKHPELNDVTSIKYTTYRQIVEEHPEYLTNTHGPILAMHDMEERLREQGVPDTSTQKLVQKEVMRQVRTNGAVIPKGSAVSSSGKNVLSKEQKEFCDANGIKYENYRRYSNLGIAEAE